MRASVKIAAAAAVRVAGGVLAVGGLILIAGANTAWPFWLQVLTDAVVVLTGAHLLLRTNNARDRRLWLRGYCAALQDAGAGDLADKVIAMLRAEHESS